MKALIASGGRGTRLRPITHTRNKHLIPIANKPILHYAIEAVAGAGISEIAIVVNADSDEVPRAIGDGSRWGVRITYIPQERPGRALAGRRAGREVHGEGPVHLLPRRQHGGGWRQAIR